MWIYFVRIFVAQIELLSTMETIKARQLDLLGVKVQRLIYLTGYHIKRLFELIDCLTKLLQFLALSLKVCEPY